MAIRRTQITLTADSGGDATGNTDRTVDGVVHAVHFDFSVGFDATTTLVLQEAGAAPKLPVLSLTNVNTDGWYYPRITLHDVADGSALVGPVDYQSVADILNLTLAGAAEDDSVVCTIVWDDQRR